MRATFNFPCLDEMKFFLLIVHPCDQEDQGGCSHKCLKKGTDFLCTCPSGSILKDDRKTCEKSKYSILNIAPRKSHQEDQVVNTVLFV